MEIERLTATVEAKTGNAQAELEALDRKLREVAKDRTARIRVRIDKHGDIDLLPDTLRKIRQGSESGSVALSGLVGAMGAFNTVIRAAGGFMQLLKFPLIIHGATHAATAINALGAGVVALSGSVFQLGGVLATIPQGLSLLGQAGISVFLAFQKVGAAIKAQTQAQTGASAAAAKGVSTARQQVAAARAVEQAQKGLQDALRASAEASEDLAKAQKKLAFIESGAARDKALEDAQFDQERAAISLEQATMRLADAQQRLSDLQRPADPLALRDAELDLKEAQNALNKALSAGAIDIGKMQDAERELGVELDDMAHIFREQSASADEVARAQLRVAQATKKLQDMQSGASAEELAEANLDVRSASLGVREAEEAQADVAENLAKINKMGTEADEDLINAREGVADATQRLEDANYRVSESHKDVAMSLMKEDTALGKVSSASIKAADAMAALSPAGRTFVNFVTAELMPKLDELRHIAETGFLPGLQRGIQAAFPLFAPLKVAIADTSVAMGLLTEDMGKFLGSPFFTGAFEQLAASNTKIINDSLRPALIDFMTGLTHVSLAARPLTEAIGEMIAGLAESFKLWAKAGEESGKLKEFFEATAATMRTLGAIFGNVWGGLVEILKIAAPTGDGFLKTIKDLTGEFEKWTKSEEGRNKIRDFFVKMDPIVREIAGLVGDVAVGFMKIGQNADTQGLIKQLRDELLPAIIKLFEHGDTPFMRSLISAASDLLPLLNALVGPTGPLTLILKGLSGLGQLFGGSGEGAQAMSGQIVAWGGVSIIAATKFGKMMDKIKDGKGILGGAAKKFGMFCKEGGGAPGDCADDTGKKVGKLSGVFSKVSEHAKKMGGKVGGAMKPLGGVIMKGLTAAGSMIGSVAGLMIPWGLIVAGALLLGVVLWKNKDKILEFFGKLPGLLMDAVSGAGKWLVDAGKTILSGLVEGITWMFWHSFPAIIWTYKDEILGFFKKAVDWLFDAGKDILGGMWAGIKWMFAHSYPVIFWTYKDQILGFFSQALTWLFDAGKSILEGMWKGIQWIWDNTIVKAFKIWVWISDIFRGAWDWLFEKGKDILGGMWEGLKDIWTSVKTWFGDRISDIVGFFGGLPKKLKDAAGDIFSFVLDSFKTILRGILGLWNRLDLKFPRIEVPGWVPGIGGKGFGDFDVFPDIGVPGWLNAAKGGVFPARKGGWFTNVAEAGEAEAVIPLSKLATVAGGGGHTINLKIEVHGAATPRAAAEAVTGAGRDLITDLVRELRSA